MTLVWALTDVDGAGAELDQPRDRLLLVIDGRARQIEMETVVTHLLLRHRQEDEAESGVVRRHETDRILGLVVDLPAQRGGPEARQPEWIVRIETEGDEPRCHPVLPSSPLSSLAGGPCRFMSSRARGVASTAQMMVHSTRWARIRFVARRRRRQAAAARQ